MILTVLLFIPFLMVLNMLLPFLPVAAHWSDVFRELSPMTPSSLSWVGMANLDPLLLYVGLGLWVSQCALL